MSVSTHLGVFEMTPISELFHHYIISKTSPALIKVAVTVVFSTKIMNFSNAIESIFVGGKC